jgi:D-ribose pyranase
MKKIGILNQPISNIIAGMGHFDMIVISDAGLPIPPEVQRVDLAVVPGLPAFVDVVCAVLLEMQVDQVTVASEMEERSPHIYQSLQNAMQGYTIRKIPHEDFKVLTRKAVAVIRTGECTPYANVIFTSGVIF